MNPFEIHKYPRTPHCIMCQVLDYYFEHFKITMKYSLIFVYSTCPQWPAVQNLKIQTELSAQRI